MGVTPSWPRNELALEVRSRTWVLSVDLVPDLGHAEPVVVVLARSPPAHKSE